MAHTDTLRGALPPARQLNWTMVAVLLSLIVQATASIWWASALDRRVSTLEATAPPGAVARIDERTASMERRLERIEGRLDAMGGRR